ncbi:Rrf2 family transcriptional regulator [Permianibacter sp. IMCC34836]|uniref:Rrf2 family transcriptional regulator n=1 Tax=Permianibacter fluminis TaxID=2738515 RepID=UPI001556737B|nr:Rrf2 family transcriptional regulator [Permianibacter fluminis]NQD37900.1 Rrf2 family transcriptional regulator [Permianibacter fluminis]
MRITQYTDYALRVLIYLGLQPDRLATIGEIAERYAISRSHLMKVVNQLVQEGFVEGVRGKGGGIRLALPAGEIRVGDVVRKIEPDLILVECFGPGNHCVITPACDLKRALYEALQAFLKVLDSYTLADFLGKQRGPLLSLLQLEDGPAAS